jgi:phosphatidylglycerophosphate synthase
MLTDLPNLLTLSRIVAIPLLVVLVALRQPSADLAACVLFSTAAITDYFDGRLARSRRQQSDLGRMLDPIADKLLVGAALMMLVGQGRMSAWGLYPAIVIMLREILVSGLRKYLAAIRIGLCCSADRGRPASRWGDHTSPPATRLRAWAPAVRAGHRDRRGDAVGCCRADTVDRLDYLTAGGDASGAHAQALAKRQTP